MKNLFYLFFLPFVIFAEQYSVELVDHKNYFELHVQTLKKFNNCHYLIATELYIEAPYSGKSGVISLYIEKDTNIAPLNNVGPDVGCVEFGKGICLPKLSIGQYQLLINNEYYGYLYVTAKKTYLESYFEINY